jgi:hypothetical protein
VPERHTHRAETPYTVHKCRDTVDTEHYAKPHDVCNKENLRLNH